MIRAAGMVITGALWCALWYGVGAVIYWRWREYGH